MSAKTKNQIEIKHWSGRVLYTHQPADSSGLTMRHALESASSSDADLRDADLSGADLRGAVLSDADLRGADLRGATVYGVKITRAPVVVDGLRWPVQIIDGHISQLHAISAWASFDDAAIAAMDGRGALRFWREHKASIMALAAPFAVTA